MSATHPRLSDRFDEDAVDDLIGPICELADLPTSAEERHLGEDDALDMLILAARKVRDREGFLVTSADL